MEFKGTPGPWEVSVPKINGEEFGAHVYVSKGGASIAVVDAYLTIGTDKQMRDAAMPNARLIAAAPELREAIQAVLPELRGLATLSPKAAELVAVCEAAEAKATGSDK